MTTVHSTNSDTFTPTGQFTDGTAQIGLPAQILMGEQTEYDHSGFDAFSPLHQLLDIRRDRQSGH